MATFEPSPDLDPKVAQAIQAAMDAVLKELTAHLGSVAAPISQPPSQGAPGDSLERMERAVEAIDSAANQAELLGTLLQQAGEFGDRSLFLVLDDGFLKGWAGYGFDSGLGDVTEVSIAVPGEIADKRPSESPEILSDICAQMGTAAPARGVLVPFVLRGNATGALYVDCLSESSELDRRALRVLTYISAQALETLPLRVPPRTAAAIEVSPVADEIEPETADAPDLDISEAIQEVDREADQESDDSLDEGIVAIRQGGAPPSPEPAIEDVDATLPESELDTLLGDPEAGAEPDPLREPEVFATQEISSLEPSETEDVVPAEPAPPIRTTPSVEVEPPSDLEGPGWAFGGPDSISDDTRHEEARRLARLLVTEIKLYNEEKVRDAREKGNVYDQLRDDIERSRRIYDERIDEEVRVDSDYFQEEVERILAGGDSTALST